MKYINNKWLEFKIHFLVVKYENKSILNMNKFYRKMLGIFAVY